MAIKPIKRYGGFTPTGIDTSGVKRMEALAGLGAAASETFSAIGEKIAIAEAPEEAIADVQSARKEAEDGTITYDTVAPASPLSWGASAYNATVSNTQLSQRNADSKQKLNDISVQYKDDPVGFVEAANAYAQAVVSSAPLTIQPQLDETIKGRILAYNASLTEEFQKKTHAANINTLTANIDNSLMGINELAYSGNLAAANSELALLFPEMDALAAADPKYAIKLDSLKKSVNNKVIESNWLGSINRIAEKDGVPAAMQGLDKIVSGKLPKGYDRDALRSFETSAQQALTRKNTRLSAQTKANAKELTKKVDNYVTAVASGMEISPEVTADIEESVKGNSELEAKVELVQEIGTFSILSKQDQTEMLADIQASGSLDSADKYAALVKANQNVEKQARANGILFAKQQGIIPKNEYVDFDPTILVDDPSTPENEYAINQADYQTRVKQAKEMSEHYGITISPFEPSEAAVLSALISDATPTQKSQIVGILGTDSAAFKQIAGNNQGVFAQAAALGNPQVMDIVFRGQEQVAKKLHYPLKALDRYQQDFDRIVGNVYGSRDKRDVLDTALAYYYGMKPGDIYNSVLFSQAIQAVTGGISTIRGHQTQLPQNVSAPDLDAYFSLMTLDQLEEAGVYQEQVDVGVAFTAALIPYQKTYGMEDVVKGGQIKAIPGKDQYVVYHKGGRVITDEYGEPVKFTVNEQVIADMKSKEQGQRYQDYVNRRELTSTMTLARDK